ncbi:MAG: hypothetical protein ABWX96_11870 [Propionibacteriaceae bacterium]
MTLTEEGSASTTRSLARVLDLADGDLVDGDSVDDDSVDGDFVDGDSDSLVVVGVGVLGSSERLGSPVRVGSSAAGVGSSAEGVVLGRELGESGVSVGALAVLDGDFACSFAAVSLGLGDGEAEGVGVGSAWAGRTPPSRSRPTVIATTAGRRRG